MKTHELKSWPEFFAPVLANEKRFELRLNDRNFMVGDILKLKEFDARAGKYTGRECERKITYLLEGIGPGAICALRGLARQYVILSLAPIE
jgi:hypothetical protein